MSSSSSIIIQLHSHGLNISCFLCVDSIEHSLNIFKPSVGSMYVSDNYFYLNCVTIYILFNCCIHGFDDTGVYINVNTYGINHVKQLYR
jgi:hypothetical protein